MMRALHLGPRCSWTLATASSGPTTSGSPSWARPGPCSVAGRVGAPRLRKQVVLTKCDMVPRKKLIKIASLARSDLEGYKSAWDLAY